MRRGPSHRAGLAFVRAFLLGRLHASGHVLTTAVIRKRFGVSQATAKRDMALVSRLVPVLPRKTRICPVATAPHDAGARRAPLSQEVSA